MVQCLYILPYSKKVTGLKPGIFPCGVCMLVCLLWFSFTAQKVREEQTNDSKLAVGVDVALATLSRMYSTSGPMLAGKGYFSV